MYFSFSLTITCLPGRLHKAYPVLRVANGFVSSESPKRNAFDQF